MKITKQRLREIIKEEIGRAIEPKDGWTTTKDPGGRKRPLRKTVPVGEEDPEDYDAEDILAMQHGNPEGSPLEETEETALNSPREAGRQWEAAKMKLTTAVTAALEDGLSPRNIRIAIEEILSSAPDEEETIRDDGAPPWTDPEVDPEADQAWWAHQLK